MNYDMMKHLGYMEETEEGRELWSKIDRLQGRIERLKMKQEQIRKKIFKMKPKKKDKMKCKLCGYETIKESRLCEQCKNGEAENPEHRIKEVYGK